MNSKKQTRATLIDTLSERCEVKKVVVSQILDVLLEEMSDALQRRESIELRGFGVFEVRSRRQSQARNPKTGKLVCVEAHDVAVFRPGKKLRLSLKQTNSSVDE